MKNTLIAFTAAFLLASPAAHAAGKLKALIIDGQNNQKE
jgi:hypothetical protein